MNNQELQTKVNEAIQNGNQKVMDLISHDLAIKVMGWDVSKITYFTDQHPRGEKAYRYRDPDRSDKNTSIMYMSSWQPFLDANHTILLVQKVGFFGNHGLRLGTKEYHPLHPYGDDKTHDARQVMNAYWGQLMKNEELVNKLEKGLG